MPRGSRLTPRSRLTPKRAGSRLPSEWGRGDIRRCSSCRGSSPAREPSFSWCGRAARGPRSPFHSGQGLRFRSTSMGPMSVPRRRSPARSRLRQRTPTGTRRRRCRRSPRSSATCPSPPRRGRDTGRCSTVRFRVLSDATDRVRVKLGTLSQEHSIALLAPRSRFCLVPRAGVALEAGRMGPAGGAEAFEEWILSSGWVLGVGVEGSAWSVKRSTWVTVPSQPQPSRLRVEVD